VLVIGGGLAVGWPIWLSLNYLLYVPMWAPFHGGEGALNSLALVLATVLSYGTGAYLMHRLEKKRTKTREENPQDEKNGPPAF
jgi:hypothetical protein